MEGMRLKEAFFIIALSCIVGLSHGSDIGGCWNSLSPKLNKCAVLCISTNRVVNEALGGESSSRNVLFVPAANLVMISGFLPFQKFSTQKFEELNKLACVSFMDVFLGKEKAQLFMAVANEAKSISETHQRLFNALKSNRTGNVAKEEFWKRLSAFGISEKSSLADIDKCILEGCSDCLKREDLKEWNVLIEKLAALKGGLNQISSLLQEYLKKTDEYLNFLGRFNLGEAFNKAKEEIGFLMSIAPKLPAECIVDVLSRNSQHILMYTHTETLLAYVIINKLKVPGYETLQKMYGNNSLIMFSDRDMCHVCENVWGILANQEGKKVTVLSSKEHDDSFLRHAEKSLLSKIPVGSAINPKWKTSSRSTDDKTWRGIFLYNFSNRMEALLYLSPTIKGIISENRKLILTEEKVKDDPDLFDKLISQSATIVRATEIYNYYVRKNSGLEGPLDDIKSSPHMLKEIAEFNEVCKSLLVAQK